MSITFQFENMLAETIGKTGISPSDLDSIKSVFSRTLAQLSDSRKSGELPFWDLPLDASVCRKIDEYVKEARNKFDSFVLLGIGGSALGPIALHTALNHPQHNLLTEDQRSGSRFFCPDNVDPDLVNGVLDVCEPSRTLFNVVSKSGGTAETAAQFIIILNLLKKRLGNKWREHLVITTDPDKGILREFAREHHLQTFEIPPKVGGRFTVLTPVGLLPAAFTGININELCTGATACVPSCFNPSFEDNPAALFAGLLFLAQSKYHYPMHVLFAYSNRLYPIADWFRQMWAESLGKKYDLTGKEVYTGPTPIKAVGATDQHSQVQLYVEGPRDKVIVFLGTKKFSSALPIPPETSNPSAIKYLEGHELGELLNVERQATTYALTSEKRPNLTIELDAIDAPHIGGLLYLFEAATLFAGGFYNVNPLDQPGVEAGKIATYALMGRTGYEQQQRVILQNLTVSKTKHISVSL